MDHSVYQFISMTYNHASIIEEHLDSIKYQVMNYGAGKRILLSIIDDCSSDNNESVIRDWLYINGTLFENVDVIINEKNLGIKHNYLKIIKFIKSARYKLLAGDDLYLDDNNIFDFMDFCVDKNLVFSKYIIQGESEKSDYYYSRMEILRYFQFLNRLLIRYSNLFVAPSSYTSLGYLEDNEYYNYLINANENCEDLPSWRYIFLVKKHNFYLYPYYTVNYRPSYGKTINGMEPPPKKAYRGTLYLREFSIISIIITLVDFLTTIRKGFSIIKNSKKRKPINEKKHKDINH